ncbi:36.4 kDa proline-rich protein [Quillaja saponaria]|uniref:36.4 kDa proline-rich protein n=1 Tax=Quillaja saponaria TaxID=32244 RepID=A0AAD7P753_QUISA|nr:36.4 kDa proline-rich protein [Quillaja saponaria]
MAKPPQIMGSNKVTAMFSISMIFMLNAFPPIFACAPCTQPHPPSRSRPAQPKIPHPKPPSIRPPPHHGGGGHGGGRHGGGHRGPKVSPPSRNPPAVPLPPIVLPPIIINPPPVLPPPVIYPPYTPAPPSGGGGGGKRGGGGGGGRRGGGGGGGYPGYGPPGGGGGVPGISPPPFTPAPKTCPINALKLGLCVDVLGGLVHIGLGNPVENACCPVLQGLLELEAAICLCTVIRLKVLNLNIFIPLALQALITCGLTPPPGFVCPPLT